MSQFYAEIKGNRGKASRMGTKKSGMWAHIRGWGIGVYINCIHDKETGKDVIHISRTGGSNSPSSRGEITEIKED